MENQDAKKGGVDALSDLYHCQGDPTHQLFAEVLMKNQDAKKGDEQGSFDPNYAPTPNRIYQRKEVNKVKVDGKTRQAKTAFCPQCLGESPRDKDWHPGEGLDQRMASFVCVNQACKCRFFVLLPRHLY